MLELYNFEDDGGYLKGEVYFEDGVRIIWFTFAVFIEEIVHPNWFLSIVIFKNFPFEMLEIFEDC